MEPEQQRGDGRRTSRVLGVALALSLAVNLAVAGVVIGHALRGGPEARGGPHPVTVRDLGFGPWTGALDGSDRAALRRLFEAEGADVRGALRGERSDRAALIGVLRADPFDAEAVDALSARLQRRSVERMDLGQRMIRAHVLQMSPAERMALADRMEAARKSRPRSGPERSGPERFGPERFGPERFGPERSGPERHPHEDRGMPPARP